MPRILFVCIGNSCRSQMAEGYARSLLPAGWEVASAGSRPAGEVDPLAVEVMGEEGIDLSRQRPKGLGDLPEGVWDLMVGMGCGDACPHLPALRRIEWDLPDPKGKPRAEFLRVRNRIRTELTRLRDELARGAGIDGRPAPPESAPPPRNS